MDCSIFTGKGEEEKEEEEEEEEEIIKLVGVERRSRRRKRVAKGEIWPRRKRSTKRGGRLGGL
jgi:hypothetical protein